MPLMQEWTSAMQSPELPVNENFNALEAQALITLATEVAATSGTSKDFTGIPDYVKRITINFIGVSTSGTSRILIQLGDGGGIETTGYTAAVGEISSGGAASFASSSAGFPVSGVLAADGRHGSITLNLEDSTDFNWTCSGALYAGGTIGYTAGSKATSTVLERVRITTVGGTDTFDSGAINISYG